jgi:glycosyltransferase 2 family protein
MKQAEPHPETGKIVCRRAVDNRDPIMVEKITAHQTEQPANRRGEYLKIGIKVVISIAIIAILITFLDPQQLMDTLQKISLWQLGLAVLLFLVCQVLPTFRWQHLAHSMRLGGGTLVYYRIYLTGLFFNLFLPTSIGGDLGRAVLLSKERACTWLQAFLSILSERFCGLGGLLFYILVCFTLLQPPQWSWLNFGVILAITITTMGFIFGFRWIEKHPTGHKLIQRFVIKRNTDNEDPGDIWPYPKAIFYGLSISIVFHACLVGIQMLVLHQLGANVSFILVATVYGLAGLAAMIPVSLSGIGLREGSATFLLMTWGNMPKETAAAFSLVWLSVILLSTIPGGLLLLKQQLIMPARKKI